VQGIDLGGMNWDLCDGLSHLEMVLSDCIEGSGIVLHWVIGKNILESKA